MATNNAINYPFYGFSATLNFPILNATGDSTVARNITNTVLYQSPDNSFNVGTGVYTCPVTGFYAVTGFCYMSLFGGGATNGSVFIQNLPSRNVCQIEQLTSTAISDRLTFNTSAIFYSTAGSFITLNAVASGGTKTVRIEMDVFFSVRYLGN